MADMMSYGDVARALDTTLARAKGLLVGLEPDLVVGNGRIILFSETNVQNFLSDKNKKLLNFLGYMSRDQSYDVVTTQD